MAGEILTTGQKNALFALMAEAGEISNKDLEAKYGVSLHGEERRRLNDLKLVGSRKVGRGYQHELLDDGWARCRDELATTRAPGGNIAFFAVLAGLNRYLERSGASLADLFAKPDSLDRSGRPEETVTSASIDDAIAAAYRAIRKRAGAHVMLSALRAKLPNYTAKQVTEALRRMASAGTLVLTPHEDQKRLSRAERDAAVRFGDQENHMVSFEAR